MKAFKGSPIDGSSNSKESSAGILLKSSSEDLVHHCLRFDFKAFNN